MVSLIEVKLRMSVKRMVTVSVSPPSSTFPRIRWSMTDWVMYLPIVARSLSRSRRPSTIELKPEARSSNSSPVFTPSTCV
jgi:hypothetical protein